MAVIAMTLAFLEQGKAAYSGDWPFYPHKSPSQPEQILHFRLSEGLPDHLGPAKVRLSDVPGARKRNGQSPSGIQLFQGALR